MNILIVDDHPIVRKGLLSIIDNSGLDANVECVDSPLKVLRKIQNKEIIDILITDIMMPGISGIDLCKKIKSSGLPIKIMVVSQFKEIWMLRQLLKLEVDSIILKDNDDKVIIEGLKSIAAGNKHYSNDIQNIIMNSFSGKKGFDSGVDIRLTKREKQVLQHIADEFTSNEIADKLNISKKTVECHRNNMLLKLGVKNVAGLIKVAFEKGLLD
ncbi:MAG: response regulator transcription factor [Bacteroidales bacterium]|nr:response regulator transcription factor [Bacteroidales bacterium]